jgi:hypothetical protein
VARKEARLTVPADRTEAAKAFAEVIVTETGECSDRGPDLYGVKILGHSLADGWSSTEHGARQFAADVRRELVAALLAGAAAKEKSK